MRTFKWYPDKALGFQGHVEIAIETYLERIELSKSLQLQCGQDSEAYGRAVAALACDRIKAVSLEHVNTGMAFSSLDDLAFTKQGTEIINKIGLSIISGVDLGNLKEPSDSRPSSATEGSSETAQAT